MRPSYFVGNNGTQSTSSAPLSSGFLSTPRGSLNTSMYSPHTLAAPSSIVSSSRYPTQTYSFSSSKSTSNPINESARKLTSAIDALLAQSSYPASSARSIPRRTGSLDPRAGKSNSTREKRSPETDNLLEMYGKGKGALTSGRTADSKHSSTSSEQARANSKTPAQRKNTLSSLEECSDPRLAYLKGTDLRRTSLELESSSLLMGSSRGGDGSAGSAAKRSYGVQRASTSGCCNTQAAGDLSQDEYTRRLLEAHSRVDDLLRKRGLNSEDERKYLRAWEQIPVIREVRQEMNALRRRSNSSDSGLSTDSEPTRESRQRTPPLAEKMWEEEIENEEKEEEEAEFVLHIHSTEKVSSTCIFKQTENTEQKSFRKAPQKESARRIFVERGRKKAKLSLSVKLQKHEAYPDEATKLSSSVVLKKDKTPSPVSDPFKGFVPEKASDKAVFIVKKAPTKIAPIQEPSVKAVKIKTKSPTLLPPFVEQTPLQKVVKKKVKSLEAEHSLELEERPVLRRAKTVVVGDAIQAVRARRFRRTLQTVEACKTILAQLRPVTETYNRSSAEISVQHCSFFQAVRTLQSPMEFVPSQETSRMIPSPQPLPEKHVRLNLRLTERAPRHSTTKVVLACTRPTLVQALYIDLTKIRENAHKPIRRAFTIQLPKSTVGKLERSKTVDTSQVKAHRTVNRLEIPSNFLPQPQAEPKEDIKAARQNLRKVPFANCLSGLGFTMYYTKEAKKKPKKKLGPPKRREPASSSDKSAIVTKLVQGDKNKKDDSSNLLTPPANSPDKKNDFLAAKYQNGISSPPVAPQKNKSQKTRQNLFSKQNKQHKEPTEPTEAVHAPNTTIPHPLPCDLQPQSKAATAAKSPAPSMLSAHRSRKRERVSLSGKSSKNSNGTLVRPATSSGCRLSSYKLSRIASSSSIASCSSGRSVPVSVRMSPSTDHIAVPSRKVSPSSSFTEVDRILIERFRRTLCIPVPKVLLARACSPTFRPFRVLVEPRLRDYRTPEPPPFFIRRRTPPPLSPEPEGAPVVHTLRTVNRYATRGGKHAPLPHYGVVLRAAKQSIERATPSHTTLRPKKPWVPKWRRIDKSSEYEEEEVEEEAELTGRGDGLNEAEKAMVMAKKRHEDDATAKLNDYEERRRAEREKEEEELKKLKEKQEKRKQEREEEERAMAERRQAEEERRKMEEEDRRLRQEAEKKRKEEEKNKRAALMGSLNLGVAGGRNFVIPEKKDKGDKFGNIVQAKQEMGMTKEQQDDAKKNFLSNLLRNIEANMPSDMKERIKQLHSRICKLETDKYDLEKRHERQEYDLKELNERSRQVARNAALRKGIDPAEAGNSRHPPKVHVAHKFDRQTDVRTFTDRKSLFQQRNAFPCFPGVPPPPTIMEKIIFSKKEEGEEGEEEAADAEKEKEDVEILRGKAKPPSEWGAKPNEELEMIRTGENPAEKFLRMVNSANKEDIKVVKAIPPHPK